MEKRVIERIRRSETSAKIVAAIGRGKCLDRETVSRGGIYAVNWHIILVCDLACKFCFQQNSDRPIPSGVHLYIPVPDAIRVLDLLWAEGCRKLTFAGGEPTLCPELPTLIRHAWALGMDVMLVTNGKGITREFLAEVRGCLSAVKISVDSNSEETLRKMGRGHGNYLTRVREVAVLCRNAGVPLMVNTVVCRENWSEDLHKLIAELRPVRWKIFQALWVQGQNDSAREDLSVTREQFEGYIARHRDVQSLVPEDNDAMTDSYVMVDPWGRFFQNSEGRYRYGRSILDVGVKVSLDEAGGWKPEKLVLRGGIYYLSDNQRNPPPSRPMKAIHADSERPRADGWRIRFDSRAERGAVFNFKNRMFDWLRNNPNGYPTKLRIRVAKTENAVYIEGQDGTIPDEVIVRDSMNYAMMKATKSQRFVATARLDRIVGTGYEDELANANSGS